MPTTMEPTSEATAPEVVSKKETETAPDCPPNENNGPSPSKQTDAVDDDSENAAERLGEGKRRLACEEFPQAVEALAEACELLSAKHGEEADELAEPYYYYGRALLELARLENGVLGNALDGVPAEEENEAELSESEQFEKASSTKDDERVEVRDQVYDAMAAPNGSEADSDKGSANAEDSSTKPSDAETPTGASDGETVTTEESAEDTETAEPLPETGEETPDDADEDKENTDQDVESMENETASSQDEVEDAEDVPHLQLSWEVLELAKKIYVRLTTDKEDRPLLLKLAQVHLCLGEVGMESEQYDQAIQDLSSCLTIQKTALEADDRLLAETHYQLGTAHLLNCAYKDAVQELRQAKTVLELRVGNLEKLSAEEMEDKALTDKYVKELAELKQLLPDIIAKVEDAEDEGRNAERAENELKETIKNGTTTVGFGASTSGTASTIATKANDISGLVRKRKPEEQATEEAKKPKADTEASPTNGQ